MEENRDHLDLGNNPKVRKLLLPTGSTHPEAVLFSASVGKINRKGKIQPRILMITSKTIFNLKESKCYIESYKQKRKVEISAVVGMTCSTTSDEFVIHFEGEYDYNYSSRRRIEVVQVVTQAVEHLVLIWEKPDPQLLKWVTQKSDLKKAIIKRPPDREAKNYPHRSHSVSYQEEVGFAEFERVRVIANTMNSSVAVVRQSSTGNQYVMKQTRIQTQRDSLSQTEKLMLERMRSPFLARISYIFETPTETSIVMEYIRGATLRDQLNLQRKFTEDQSQFLCSEIILGLHQLHSMNLAYGRLRPSNIVLREGGHALLWDFASVRDVSDTRGLRYDDSAPQYVPPECLKGEEWGLAADWWSFGIVLYEMLVGITPFENQNVQVMNNSIKLKNIYFPVSTPLSNYAEDLIHGLLQKDPSSRLGSKGACEVQSHPFFSSVHLPSIMAGQLLSPIHLILPPSDTDPSYNTYGSRRFTTSL